MKGETWSECDTNQENQTEHAASSIPHGKISQPNNSWFLPHISHMYDSRDYLRHTVIYSDLFSLNNTELCITLRTINTRYIYQFIRRAILISLQVLWTCLDSYSCMENIIESYLRVNMLQIKSQDMKSISKSNITA